MAEASYAKALFHGVIAEEMAFPWPKPRPEDAESIPLLVDSVQRFLGDRVDPARIDRDGRIPPEVVRGLKELGLFGTIIPPEYGGGGLSATAYCRVMQEVAAHDASLAVTLGKTYRQEGTLSWGYLTPAEERSRHVRLTHTERKRSDR